MYLPAGVYFWDHSKSMRHGVHSGNDKPAQAQRSKARIRVRWALAVLSIALAIAAAGFAATDKLSSQTSFDPTPYFDAKKAGIDIRVEHSKSYFEMTLLTLGALWALIVGQKGEARIRLADRQEILMLSGASVALFLSVIWHNFYLDAVSAAYSRATDLSLLPGAPANVKGVKMPDVFQPAIDSLLQYQARFFVCGVALAIFTLISAHNLKEDSI